MAETLNINWLGVARAHIEERNREGRHHIFITFFESNEISEVEKPMITSPYSNVFGYHAEQPKVLAYLEEKFKELESLLLNLGVQGGPFIIDLIGESRTGKTTLLLALCDAWNRPNRKIEYLSMQEFGNTADEKKFAAIWSRTVDSHILVLDEADVVTPQLHQALKPNYPVIVYGSHTRLPFDGLTELRLERQI